MRYTIIPRTVCKFGKVGQAQCTVELPLATRVDTSRVVSGAVTTRLHAKSGTFSAAVLQILIYNVSYTSDEPDVVYRKGTAVATITVNAGDSAPGLYVEPFVAPISDQVQVVLSYAQGADTGEQTYALSVELELRDS